MDPSALGQRLKQLRESRSLSLRGLSRQTGIATSFLAALEHGKNSVSVAKLKTILEALGVSLSVFFSQTDESAPQDVYRKAELLEISGQGKGISYKEVAAGRPGRALQLIIEHYEVSGDTGPELYSHHAQEAGLVIKGTLELTIGDRVYELKQGDAYYFDSRRPHRFRNTGTQAAEAISVNTPPSF